MLKRIYDWCIDAADKPYALWILAAVSFAESSFFPVPPDIMLLPMSLAQPKRAWWFATVCTIASVAGGVLGYAIGALLYDSLGQWLITSLWSQRQGRSLPRLLCRMGRGDHPAQGPDPDPLQARDHHLGLCRLQHLAVHPVLDRRARRTVLHGRDAAQPLRRLSSARNWRSGLASGSRSAPSCLVLGFYIASGWSSAERRLADARASGYAGIMLDRRLPRSSASDRAVATATMALSMLTIAPDRSPGRKPHRHPRLACSRRPSNRCRLSPRRSRPSLAPPAREENPGLIDEIGKLFEKSKSMLPHAEEPERDHRRSQHARQGRRREPVATWQNRRRW